MRARSRSTRGTRSLGSTSGGWLQEPTAARRRPRPQYRAALAAQPRHPTAAFNLGTALEDLGRRAEAIDAYRRAVEADADFADAHFNLARLYEQAGKRAAALRHLRRTSC